MDRERRLVVKDNALIDASFNLSLVEQRLMLLAIVEAREIPSLTMNTAIKVSVKSYIDQYKVKESTAYESLQEAVNTLFERQFSYYDNATEERYKERWIYKASYIDNKGYAVLFFTPTVIGMISRLEKQFTKYHLEQVSDFKSKYSIRLYELLVQYLNLGSSKKYDVSEIREKLGLSPTEYKTMSLFKVNVLDKAVNEINKKTEITIKYDQFKDGRTVSHFLFKIKQKPIKADKNTINMFNTMSAKQVHMFGDKLSKLNSFQSHYKAEIGENTEQYAERIKLKLLEPFYVNAWIQYLEQVGYVATKLSK
jgi:plasmid replication initiation protein